MRAAGTVVAYWPHTQEVADSNTLIKTIFGIETFRENSSKPRKFRELQTKSQSLASSEFS